MYADRVGLILFAQIIRRNVVVARQQIESCRHEREEAKKRRSMLESRKEYVLESIAKAKAREQQLLQSLRAVEREDDAMVASAVDKKQREVLRQGYNAEKDTALVALVDRVNQLRMKTTMDESSQEQIQLTGSAATAVNPIEMLLAEYLRMLKSGKTAEDVEFGDSDIAVRVGIFSLSADLHD